MEILSASFYEEKRLAKGINDLWQADLVDLSSLARDNDGYRYLLTCIDVFSKIARAVPVRNKNAKSITDAFATLIVEEKPVFLQTNKGTQFLNAIFQKLFKDNDIKHYTSENDEIKCSVVEHWNRTILTKLFKYFTYKNTRRYLDVLSDLLSSYNSTFHRSIKMSPNEVNYTNESVVRKRLYPPKPKGAPKYKFLPNDTVRLGRTRAAFTKGYAQKWSTELFKISCLHPTYPSTYGLIDLSGKSIKGPKYLSACM